jgi:hypothetical protein
MDGIIAEWMQLQMRGFFLCGARANGEEGNGGEKKREQSSRTPRGRQWRAGNVKTCSLRRLVREF